MVSSKSVSDTLIKMAAVLLLATTKLDQGKVFTGICNSVNRGVSASLHAGMHTPPRSRHSPRADPPGADTPQNQVPPGTKYTPQTKYTPWD